MTRTGVVRMRRQRAAYVHVPMALRVRVGGMSVVAPAL